MESTDLNFENGIMLSELIKKLMFLLIENGDKRVRLQGLEYGAEYHQPVSGVASLYFEDGEQYVLIEGRY